MVFTNVSDLLMYVKIIYGLVSLLVFSIYDLRYREIPDKYVWGFLSGCILLFIFSLLICNTNYPLQFILIYIIMSLVIVPGLFFVLYKLDYIGEADFYVVLGLSILFPLGSIYKYVVFYENSMLIHIPPILVMVLYSTAMLVVLTLLKGLVFGLAWKKYLPKNLGIYKKILLLFIGKPMRIKDFLKSKHYYPLTVFKPSNEGVEVSYRLSFSVEEEDYRIHQNKLKELIDKGIVDPEQIIWVTYGIPYIVALLFGYLLLLVLGDYPVLFLFTHIIY